MFQVGVAPAWKQRSLKTLNPFANDAHAISLTHASPCSSVWMMPAIRSHACLSLGELTPARRRDRVEPGFAIGFRGAPIPAEQATLLQPHQRRIQRAHIELQRAAGHLLEARGNGVAVQRPERIQRLKDHQVECALQNVGFGSSGFIRHANGISLRALERQMK